MWRVKRILKLLPTVFRPTSPVTDPKYLQGRSGLLAQLQISVERPGAGVILYGDRRVGKTSVAKVISEIVSGRNFYYSAARGDSFETIVSAVLSHYDVGWVHEHVEYRDKSKTYGGLRSSQLEGGVTHEKSLVKKDKPILKPPVTPQEVAQRLPRDQLLIVIDNFEQVDDKDSRQCFFELAKVLSDSEVSTTLMLVTVQDAMYDFLDTNESIKNIFEQVEVFPLEEEHIRSIIKNGMRTLGIKAEESIIEKIVDLSGNLPYYTHLLCDAAVRCLLDTIESGRKNKYRIEDVEFSGSFPRALKNSDLIISQTYEREINRLNSPLYERILYAVAAWPEDFMDERKMSEWVGIMGRQSEGYVNMSEPLRQLTEAGMLKKGEAGGYRFHNPLMKYYVKIRSAHTLPSAILHEIEAIKEKEMQEYRAQSFNRKKTLGEKLRWWFKKMGN